MKRAYYKRIKIEDSQAILYSLLWGQCSELTRAEVEGLNGLVAGKEAMNGIGDVRDGTENNKYAHDAAVDAINALYRQMLSKSCSRYREDFISRYETMEGQGVSLDVTGEALTDAAESLGVALPIHPIV